MKIIKPGTHMNRQWTAQFECTGHGNGNAGCGALLEITASDLYQTYNSCMGRSETWFATFMCPCCGEQTDIANTDGYRHPNAKGAPRPRDLMNPGQAAIKEAKRRLLEDSLYVSPIQVAKGTHAVQAPQGTTKVASGMEASVALDGDSLENRMRWALDG